MKQLMKILGIIGSILCISGLSMFGVGYAFGGSDYIATTDYENYKKALHLTEQAEPEDTVNNKVSSDNTKTAKKNSNNVKTYKLKSKKLGSFSSISANLSYVDLVIQPSKDQNAYLSYELFCKNSKNPFSYSIKNGCLYLKESNLQPCSLKEAVIKKNNIVFVGNKSVFFNNTNPIILYVPSKKSFKNSFFNMKDGDLHMNGLHCQTAKLNLKYGDTTIKKTSLDKASITTIDGDINMNNLTVSKTINIKTENGDILASKMKVPGTLSLDTIDGDINASNLHVSGNVKIDTEDGDINVSSLSASGKVQITTIDGDINAPNLGISGDLQITVEDGDINMPNLHAYASGTIKIESDYGDINASRMYSLGKVQLDSNGGDILLQINKQCINRMSITLDVMDGNMSIGKSLHGSKKRRGDGWSYTKKAAKGKASLKVRTREGDISAQ